ncbi:MAG: cell division protein FtsL [Burkholderiales bacterium]|nr:cell division protein FtsL [Burkholderiales bacterium]
MVIAIVICALALITTQHRARGLFVALERENQLERQLENDWTQLQAEQVSLSKGSRVEEIARTQLKLRTPEGQKTRYLSMSTLAAQEGKEAAK